MFKSELDVRNWELLDKGQIKLGICRDCGAWTAEVWDQSEQQYMRQWACTPFRFDVGARVRVKLKGKYNGMVGTVTQRKRVIKKGYPLSAPENYYFILFGEDQNQKDFKEENLELHT
ncbi:MAG TPA: hypothetical protein VEF33_06870 [Syntrophales bacterium]|nr:hypothetical protein [Syntrophales bacterium]